MALCVGILALAPPPIVGAMASIPSWSKALVAAFAFATAAWQIVGIASVVSDKRSLYRLYIRVNFLATLAILAITIAFTVTAAARHSTAVAACYSRYEGSLAQDGLGVQGVENSLVNGRHKVCDILCWVDVGLMGGLILLLGLTQLFMCYMQRKYGQRQRSAYSYEDKPYGANGIPLASRSPGNWDFRGRPHYSPVPDPSMNQYARAGDNREYYQARQY
ncbi:hypothetical protein MPSI1_001230 [Malassezia psittaci]|uniref:Uncharacterized protein n=1 Tax=Malassezia psittaci TaxID=1821823 RepID=A0AAF0JDP0_9BASI|nr:hypothetical protein MPSI1_001230 [Malassezia psittaci]